MITKNTTNASSRDKIRERSLIFTLISDKGPRRKKQENSIFNIEILFSKFKKTILSKKKKKKKRIKLY